LGIVRTLASKLFGEEKARAIWDRLEIIGDIAVLKSPMLAGLKDPLTLEEYKELAKEIMKIHKNVKSVWLAISPTSGKYRVRGKYIHLAGEPRSETIYKEHGCRFKVDITKVFITPRLSYEHIRVASLVRDGEEVVNMFAGVGTFSIIIACKSRVRRVHSIDINPDAWRYMVENIKINKVEDKVIPYLGDAAEVIETKLSNVATRVLMPLPELALDYLKYAIMALKGRGTIHVYLHVKSQRKEDPILKAIDMVKNRVEGLGVKLIKASGRIVRLVGPRVYQVVVDVDVEKP
jgi:tRNA (guanine37-N1)-methyltransferase